MNYFLDTSSLVKIYHREVGTPEVLALYQNSECNLIISELCRIEFTSTVYRKHRENRLNFKAFKALLNKFQEDLDSRYEVLRFSSLVTVEAETLLHRYAEKHSLKSLDSLQFAFFKAYGEATDLFVCSDSKLSDLVKREGFQVMIP